MFRFLYDKTGDNIGGVVGINPNFDIPSSGKTFGINFNHIYAFTNSFVNEFRLGFSRANIGFFLPNPTGIASTTPDITIPGTSNIALSSTFPQGRISNNYQLQDSVTYTFGRHAVRGGVDLLRQLATQVAPFNCVVRFHTRPVPTTPLPVAPLLVSPTSSTTTGEPAPAPVAIVFGSGRYHPNLFTIGLYVQDTYKATPNLTLTYGLRYENFGQPANIFKYPAFVGYGELTSSRPPRSTRTIITSGPLLASPTPRDWSDHGIGNGTTVIRGGYQVTYDVFYNNLLSNMAAASPNALANTPVPSNSTATTPRGLSNMSAVLPSLVPVPLTPFSSEASNFSKNIRNPYYHHFSLGVQHQFPANIVLDVAYVGSLGRQLLYTNPLNPASPDATFTATATETTPPLALRPLVMPQIEAPFRSATRA